MEAVNVILKLNCSLYPAINTSQLEQYIPLHAENIFGLISKNGLMISLLCMVQTSKVEKSDSRNLYSVWNIILSIAKFQWYTSFQIFPSIFVKSKKTNIIVIGVGRNLALAWVMFVWSKTILFATISRIDWLYCPSDYTYKPWY